MVSRGDAALWLWRSHNLVSSSLSLAAAAPHPPLSRIFCKVNVRLMKEERDGRSHSGDPLFPKAVFPSLEACPKCRQ